MSFYKLGDGIYTSSDAASILGISTSAARYWFNRYARDILGKSSGHAYGYDNGHGFSVNFYTLIEMYVFYALKEEGISTPKIIDAHTSIGKALNSPYPFAHKNIFIVGKDLFFEHTNGLLSATTELQYAFEEIILPFGKKLDYDDQHLAERLYPMGKEHHIVVDPSHQFGSPVVAHTNILVSTLSTLYSAGESIDFIAKLYDLEIDKVRDAVSFANVA